MNMAEELIAPGGPSAPVWTMMGLIITGVITIIIQQIKSRQAAIEAKYAATKAAENTTSISNGFAGGVDSQLKQIITTQQRMQTGQDDIGKAIREHLEWHLNNPSQKGK